MPQLIVGENSGVVNESGKVQILYRNGNPLSFNPGDVVPMDLAFIDGSVHPSLLPPPVPTPRVYKKCGGCSNKETDDDS